MRILILEDDLLIAFDLQCLVEECGHEVVEICGTLSAVWPCIDRPIDFALLDVDLPDGKSFALAGALEERAIPYAFVSASRPSELPDHLRHARFVAKPYQPATIRNALRFDAKLAS